jgi:hypothetical protein
MRLILGAYRGLPGLCRKPGDLRLSFRASLPLLNQRPKTEKILRNTTEGIRQSVGVSSGVSWFCDLVRFAAKPFASESH